MSSTSENETEILLGNRHLLAIFFVLAVLLGIAFTGGYMVGRNSTDKRPSALSASAADPAASTSSTSMETHALPPATDNDQPAAGNDQTRTVPPPPPEPASVTPAVKDDAPLGAPKQERPTAPAIPAVKQPPPKPTQPPPSPHVRPIAAGAFSGPQSGQTFLQVAAVGHTEANAVAEVLSKKGFHAHAVPKPGASNLYRVLIGPLRDTNELASTRDSLRKAGFTQIFVQRY